MSKVSKKRSKKSTKPSENEEFSEYSEILDKLKLDKSTLLSGIRTLNKVLEQKRSEGNLLLDDADPIFLQLSLIKIAKCPARTVRFNLKHSLYDDDASVCFIASDVKGMLRKEHEKATEWHERYLDDLGVDTKISKVMSYHELKNDYGEFEMKRKLLCSYDVFLVDAKISKYVSKHLGKIFRSKRRFPIPIRIGRGTKLQMKYALMKTSMNLHSFGDCLVVQVGNMKMKEAEMFENIVTLCEGLDKEIPGGWENIRAINLKTDLSMAVPIYFNLRKSNEVKTPVVKPKRPKAFKTVEGELSTKNKARVVVHPSGTIVVHKNDLNDSDSD